MPKQPPKSRKPPARPAASMREKKAPGAGTDAFVLRCIADFQSSMKAVNRGLFERFDLDEDSMDGEFGDEITPAMAKARESLAECGRVAVAAFDLHSVAALRLVKEFATAREAKDTDGILKTGAGIFGNVAKLALYCEELNGLHEAFVGDIMGDLPEPREAARKLGAVTHALEALFHRAGRDTDSVIEDGLNALKKRFDENLGDLPAAHSWLGSPDAAEQSSLSRGKNTLNRAVAGGVLATAALCRDLHIYIGMLGDMTQECGFPWTDIGTAYQWIQPSPTGDGKTEQTAFEFHHARNKFEAVGLAHEFLGSLIHGSHAWCLANVDDRELTEYADTRKGKIWFRYRMDPKVLSPEMLTILNEE